MRLKENTFLNKKKVLNDKELYTYFENEILLYFCLKVIKKKILSQHLQYQAQGQGLYNLITRRTS